jgi:hypothetical protein
MFAGESYLDREPSLGEVQPSSFSGRAAILGRSQKYTHIVTRGHDLRGTITADGFELRKLLPSNWDIVQDYRNSLKMQQFTLCSGSSLQI